MTSVGSELSVFSKPPRSFALIPAAIALLAVCNLSIPYYALAPGPAADVGPLLAIKGTGTFPGKGRMYLTTVSLRSVRVADAIVGAVDPTIAVVPRDEILPPKRSEREQDEQNARQMEDSKNAAALAALAYLGIPVQVTGEGARIVEVFDGTPAAGVLQTGDVVFAINGRNIVTVAELVSTLQKPRPGTRFTLSVRRGDARLDLPMRTQASADTPPRPVIGVRAQTENERINFPFTIEIRSGGIGGPSAGLIFALAIIDRLEDGDLANGHDVAGTGVITLDGRVDRVGGVVQKVAAAERAGAEVFLVPKPEEQAARRVARRIKIVGVSTLAEAVEALRKLTGPVRATGSD